jgi:micrococcal nuclease
MRTIALLIAVVALATGCGSPPPSPPTIPPAPPAARSAAPAKPAAVAAAPRPAPASPAPAPPAPSPLDLALATPPAPAPPPAAAAGWRVVAVSDGDTVRAVDGDNVERRIRLVGIDAPETAQPFGTVARRRLADLVMGKVVAVDDRGQDAYGRTLARLEVDGIDVSRQMVADGMAWHFTRYSDDADLAAAEAAARAAGLGLWRDPNPMPPWEWRATEKRR